MRRARSEVMRDGLRTLRARDAAIEQWLRQDVMAAHESYLKDPSRGSPTDVCLRGFAPIMPLEDDDPT